MEKKIRILFAAVLFCLCLLFSAEDGHAANSDFVISNGVLTAYKGTDKSVVVPAGVKEIGDHAFYDNQTMCEITLPQSLKTIGEDAFYNCDSLWRVNLPSSGLITIEDWAFYECTSLKSITFPSTLKTIGDYAFDGCVSLSSVTVPVSVTSIGSWAIDSTCTKLVCSKGTAGFDYLKKYYYDENPSMYRVIGAKDISRLKIKLSQKTFSYVKGGSAYPSVTVSDGSKKLDASLYSVSYSNNSEIGRAAVTVSMYFGDGSYTGSKTLSFSIVLGKVTYLVSGLKTSSASVALRWQAVDGADSYEVERWDASANKWKRIGTTKKASWTDKNKKADTRYGYRVRAKATINDKAVYGDYSKVLRVTTLPSAEKRKETAAKVDSGKAASISETETNTGVTLDTQSIGWGNWSHVSDICQFQDEKGNYCYGYQSGSKIIIRKYNSKLKKVATVKFKYRYPLLGGIACDSDGNYYVVWGQNDTAGNGGVVTVAVSKYTKKGKHVKTVTYKTASNSSDNYWETRYPFDAGNCVISISGSTLICSYGREMYNGHQSNDILAVNTKSMKKLNSYSNYASHSFNQSLLISSTDDVVYTNHGDAYPRAIDTAKQSLAGSDSSSCSSSDAASNSSFHFYGDIGGNYTGAQLGGTAEISSGYMLAAAGPRSMTEASYDENRDVFVQLLDKASLRSFLNASRRKGTAGSSSYTDTGIKWLTNYSSKYTANAVSIVATADDRAVVFWEKLRSEDSSYVCSYYTILAANGVTLQKATPFYRRLNLYENPVYKNGAVYWTVADGSSAKSTTYKMNLSKLTVDKKVDRVTNLKVSFTYDLQNNSGYFSLHPRVTLSWDVSICATGYQIYRSDTADGPYKKIATVKDGSCSYQDTPSDAFDPETIIASSGPTYYYKVRAYRKTNGKRYYSEFAACHTS